MIKRGIAVFLTVLALFRSGMLPVGAVGENRWVDVKETDWFFGAVSEGVENGLFAGTSADRFSPYDLLTREMFVSVLYRFADAHSLDLDTGANPFTDVPDGEWYTDAVIWAYAAGITSGVSETAFGVGMPITREQVAALTVHMIEAKTDRVLSDGGEPFADEALISSFAKPEVSKARAAGLLSGRGDNCFAPGEQMIRAEAAQLFLNLEALFAVHMHSMQSVPEYVAATGGIRFRLVNRCTECDFIQSYGEYQNGRLPVLELVGNTEGISKDNEVTLQATYNAADLSFTSSCTLKWQGSSSLAYEKKNYNIKLYRDDTLEKKNKIDLGWGAESKYCLKANFTDCTQTRNLVSARLWGDMVRCRPGAQEPLTSLVNGGAVDGFPVMVYINEVYQGLYTLNIPKDKWMLEDDTHEVAAIVMTGDWEDTVRFRAEAVLGEEHWEIEENNMGGDSAVLDSLNALISFVMENDGDAFKEGISTYLDVNSYIDYMCLTMAAAMPDNTAKNCLYVTYDGVQWIATMYDMDTSFGLYWDGTEYYAPSVMVPSVNNGNITFRNVDNLLWERMGKLFAPQIAQRYFELREGPLSEEHIYERFDFLYAMVPQMLRDAEVMIYPNGPGYSFNTMNFVRTFTNRHLELLDIAIGSFPVE